MCKFMRITWTVEHGNKFWSSRTSKVPLRNGFYNPSRSICCCHCVSFHSARFCTLLLVLTALFLAGRCRDVRVGNRGGLDWTVISAARIDAVLGEMSSGRRSELAKRIIGAVRAITNRISNREVGISSRAFSSGSSTALIKQLRERTGAPMKDVKAALLQCDWDSEAAFTELRKKGLAAAGKKAGRVAADGLLGVAAEQGARAAAVVEINSETDFVARNDLFQHLVSQVARAALSVESSPRSVAEAAIINLQALEAAKIELKHPKLSGESTVSDALAEVASIMGENVKLRRGFYLSSPTGIVAYYLHSSTQAGLARVAGLLTLEPSSDSQSGDHQAELTTLGESLAMHIVAQRPLFLSKDLVAREALQHERDILTSQALASGKPANVIEKMVAGRLSKYMQEVALLEQKYVLDEAKSVKSVLNEASKQLQGQYNIGRFLRVEVGEGIQRGEKNFAAEVAAQAA